MRILITDKPVKVTASMETKVAPCVGCMFFQPRSDSAPVVCLVEGRVLSGSVIKSCEQHSWHRALK